MSHYERKSFARIPDEPQATIWDVLALMTIVGFILSMGIMVYQHFEMRSELKELKAAAARVDDHRS